MRDVFTFYLKYTKPQPGTSNSSSNSRPTERLLQFVVNVVPKLFARVVYTQKNYS